eukprot:7492705-Pyramimonas_sp.AAC.1
MMLKIANYCAQLNGIGRGWVVVGDWNLTPDQISRPIRDGVGGYVLAPDSPTCAAELPGSII